MPIVRTTCLIFLLTCSVALHAQEPNPSPCHGSTVDSGTPETASSSRAFVVELQKLVRDGDKKGIASRVGYPLRVNRTVGGKLMHRTIRNRQQFLEAYGRLFNSKVRTAILDPSSVRCLFANDQGFMIGDGALWFEQVAPKSFRISALNP